MAVLRRKESGEVLLDVIIQVVTLLAGRGITETRAVDAALEAAELLGQHWSSQCVYFSGKTLALKLLETELANDFDGTKDSIIALARKHCVTVRTVYKFLERQRERKKKAPQHSAKGECMGGIRREEAGQVLLDCILQIAKLLTEKGVAKETAVVVAQEVAEFLARHWNGYAVYFSSKTLGRRLVEAAIEKNFDGSRTMILALMRKHNVSQTFCYETLKRLREKQKKKTTELQNPL
jgi:Mor family transcriptional regulator